LYGQQRFRSNRIGYCRRGIDFFLGIREESIPELFFHFSNFALAINRFLFSFRISEWGVRSFYPLQENVMSGHKNLIPCRKSG
jgi:hypothetical protein